MHYYVDGYNLLFRVFASEISLQKQRGALLSFLSRKAIQQHLSITVVFDAPKQPEGTLRGHHGPLEVVYTSSGESADDYIISIFNVPHRKDRIVVVTSDRELMRRAQQAGARVMTVEAFLKRKTQNAKCRTEEHSAIWDVSSALKSSPVSPQPLDETTSRYLALFQNSPEPALETEFERWLRLFEKSLEENL